MATFHCTLFFAYQQYGWVEQFFRSGPSVSAALAETSFLASARWAILGAGVSLYRVRVSQVGAPRVSIAGVAPGRALAAPAMAPIQGATIRVIASSGGLYRRSYCLRGLPRDAVDVSSGFARWTGPYAVTVPAWLQLLATHGWQLQCWGRAGPQLPLVALVGVLDLPGDPLVPPPANGSDVAFRDLVLAAVSGRPVMPPVEPGTDTLPTVRIGRATWGGRRKTSPSPPNGEWLPLLCQDDRVTYLGQVPDSGFYTGGGYLQLRPRLYLPIQSTELGGVETRACGPAPRAAELGPIAAAAEGPLRARLAVQLGPVPALLDELAAWLKAHPFPEPTLPVPGPVVPVPPPIPPSPGPVNALPEPPVPVTCNTLHDIGIVMQSWLQFNSLDVTVGWCKALNLTNTWCLFLGGISDLSPSYRTGQQLLVALALLMNNIFNPYFRQASAILRSNIPLDAKLMIYGYSLGGLCLDNICLDFAVNQRARAMVTFAAPLPGLGGIGPGPFRRFRVPQDLVTYMTTMGIAAMTLTQPYTNLLPDLNFVGFPECHQFFLLHPQLKQYDPFGQPIGSGNPGVILDTMQRQDLDLTPH